MHLNIRSMQQHTYDIYVVTNHATKSKQMCVVLLLPTKPKTKPPRRGGFVFFVSSMVEKRSGERCSPEACVRFSFMRRS